MKVCELRRVLATALLASACAGDRADNEAPGTEPIAIRDGEASPPSDDAVVQVYVFFGARCSGTLIAPNVVVTALHCVTATDLASGSVTCNEDGSLAADASAGSIGALLDPRDVEIFFGAGPGIQTGGDTEPSAFGAQIFGSGATSICSDNIAAIVLDRDLPVAGLPVRVTRPVVVGEEVTLVGYDQPAVIRERRSRVPVLAVGPDDLTAGAGDLVPRTFLVGDGPCWGDQGGPAISDETGALVGLFSFTPTGADWMCNSGLRSLYAKVAPHSALLERALESTGRSLRIEREVDRAAAGSGCSSARLTASWRTGAFLVPLLALVFQRLVRRRARSLDS
jgi:hypothetical protein